MDVRTHARLMTMVDDGDLAFAAADPLRACRLRQEGLAHGRWAEASTEAGDHDGAFRLAYRACGDHCTAVLLSVGLEPAGDETCRALYRAAAALADTAALHRAVRRADDLRRVVDAVLAGTHALDRDDAVDAVAAAVGLGRHTLGVLKQRYPGMVRPALAC